MKNYILAIDISKSRRHEDFEAINRKAFEVVISEMRGKKNYRLHVFGYDLGVFDHRSYCSDNIEQLVDYKITYNGVEDSYLESVISYVKNLDLNPKRAFILTDKTSRVRLPFKTNFIIEKERKLVYR